MNKLMGLVVIGLLLVGVVIVFNKNKIAKKEKTVKQISQTNKSNSSFSKNFKFCKRIHDDSKKMGIRS